MGSGGTIPAKTGKYVGTGAAKDVLVVGFSPRVITFVNLTTGATAEWLDTMADDSCVTHDSGTDAIVTSQGVTPETTGFSLGTNAVVNKLADVIHYCAQR